MKEFLFIPHNLFSHKSLQSVCIQFTQNSGRAAEIHLISFLKNDDRSVEDAVADLKEETVT
jgi:hypothetical protein